MISQPIVYNAYTEFYTHAGNICYFLESEYFQDRVEDNILSLHQSVIDTISTLLLLHNVTNSMSQQV